MQDDASLDLSLDADADMEDDDDLAVAGSWDEFVSPKRSKEGFDREGKMQPAPGGGWPPATNLNMPPPTYSQPPPPPVSCVWNGQQYVPAPQQGPSYSQQDSRLQSCESAVFEMRNMLTSFMQQQQQQQQPQLAQQPNNQAVATSGKKAKEVSRDMSQWIVAYVEMQQPKNPSSAKGSCWEDLSLNDAYSVPKGTLAPKVMGEWKDKQFKLFRERFQEK